MVVLGANPRLPADGVIVKCVPGFAGRVGWCRIVTGVKPDTRYITPAAIGEVRQVLRDDLIPIFDAVRQILDENESIAFPGWGLLGEWTIGALYSSLLDTLQRDADAARSVLTGWEDGALKYAQRNWIAAEDAAVQRVKP